MQNLILFVMHELDLIINVDNLSLINDKSKDNLKGKMKIYKSNIQCVHTKLI